MVGGQSDSAGRAASRRGLDPPPPLLQPLAAHRRRVALRARSGVSDSPGAAVKGVFLGRPLASRTRSPARVLQEHSILPFRLLELRVAEAREPARPLRRGRATARGAGRLSRASGRSRPASASGFEGGSLLGAQASSFPVTLRGQRPRLHADAQASPTLTSAASRTRRPEPSKTSAYPRESTASGESGIELAGQAGERAAPRREVLAARARASRLSWAVRRVRRSAIWRSQRKASSRSPARR
jgi:hypothetical protein